MAASTPVWRPSRARARHAGFGIADVSGSCRVATTELPNRCWRVRMKSVSRAAQGRAGRPAVGVPVSSATGGKAGPMRVAACALAITAAIAASPAHAQYYSVDDGGTPGGNSTNNGATGAGSWPPGRMRPRTGLRRRRWDPTRRHREITPSPSASMRWRLARIACRSEEALAFSRMPQGTTSRWARWRVTRCRARATRQLARVLGRSCRATTTRRRATPVASR